MRKSLLAALLLLVRYATCSAIQFGIPSDATSHAMGGCSAVEHLRSRDRPQISMSYLNNFAIPELGTSTLSLFIPTHVLDTDLSISYYGHECYGELYASLLLSHRFGKYFSLGVGASYAGLRSTVENNFISTGTADLALSVFPVRNITISFLCRNISFSSFKTSYGLESLPTIFKLAISYTISNKVQIEAEAAKDLTTPFYWGTGVDYRIIDMLSMRIGVHGQNNISPSIGLGLFLRPMSVNISARWNVTLGISAAATITFYLDRKEK